MAEAERIQPVAVPLSDPPNPRAVWSRRWRDPCPWVHGRLAQGLREGGLPEPKHLTLIPVAVRLRDAAPPSSREWRPLHTVVSPRDELRRPCPPLPALDHPPRPASEDPDQG